MITRIEPTLLLLDQGLSLYRRHFLSFVLVAASWFVPIAVLVGLGIIFGGQMSEGTILLLVLVGVLVFFVLMVYLVAVLSRAAALALDEQPLRLGEVLRVAPLRLVAMTAFTVVYLVLAQLASSLVSLICICPAYLFGIALIGGTAAIGSEVGSVSAVLLFVLIFGVIYLFGLFVSGAVYGGMVYGLQPWAHERVGFGQSLQRSIDSMLYRFWHNVGVWGIAAVILAAVGLTVAGAIGVVLPLPLTWAFGSTPAVQAVTVGAWLLGLVLVLPPLPIWMALLYRRNNTAREGSDLQARVDAWQQQNVS